MADAHNFYRAWLGVTSESLPPTHYELLGLTAERCDAQSIAEGFRRQMSRLNPHLSGEHAATAQRIASELAHARVVLLTPTTKRAYDAELVARRQKVSVAPPASASAAATTAGSLAGGADDLLPPQAAPLPALVPAAPVVPVPAPTTIMPPANQPPPPMAPAPYAAIPGTAVPGVAGYIQPGGYAQGAGQAYVPGATPAMAPGGYQPTPGYAVGQPYPAPGGFPAPQPVLGQPTYQGLPAYPGQGLPVSPAYLAVAPQPAAPAVSTGASTSSVSRLSRSQRSAAGPILAGVMIAGLAVAGGGYYLLKLDSAQATAGGTNASTGGAVAANPQLETPASDSQVARRSPRDDATRRKPVKPLVVAPVASGSKEKLFDPNAPDPEPPPVYMPVEMPDNDGPQPGAAAAPAPIMPKPEQPQPAASAGLSAQASPEEQAAVGEALAAARRALANRDFVAAENHLAEATLEATASDSLAAVERLELVQRYLKDFWDAVRQQLDKLDGAETITVDGKELNIIEATREKIIFRSAGKRYEYAFAKLPAKLAYWLADSWLDHGNPAAYLVLGAFHALDAQGDRQQARRLFDQAAAGGLDVQMFVAELEAEDKGK